MLADCRTGQSHGFVSSQTTLKQGGRARRRKAQLPRQLWLLYLSQISYFAVAGCGTRVFEHVEPYRPARANNVTWRNAGGLA